MHVLRQLMWIEYTGHRLLNTSLILRCFPQRFLTFLQVQITRIISGEFFDLDEKVSEMFLECWQVLIQVKEALDDQSDLGTIWETLN